VDMVITYIMSINYRYK